MATAADRRVPPNPFMIGDPRYGLLICRRCGGHIYADQPYRQVVRLWWLPGRGPWNKAFAHQECPARKADA